MKRVWNTLIRPLKNFRYQKKAIKYVEKISSGEITEPPQIYEEDRKYYEASQKDERIRKELSIKHEDLVKNMYMFKINSNEVVEHYPSERPLPTRETEWEHRNDAEWEFGYYEPPVEKVPKGKLMFREALEILHARQELFGDSDIPRTKISESKEILEHHPAVNRVEKECLDRMWQYFRPFERYDTQDVVSVSELEQLHSMLVSSKEEVDIIGDIQTGFAKLLNSGPVKKKAGEKLDEEEKRQFMQEAMLLRFKQTKRLSERLKEIGPPVLKDDKTIIAEEKKNGNVSKEEEK